MSLSSFIRRRIVELDDFEFARWLNRRYGDRYLSNAKYQKMIGEHEKWRREKSPSRFLFVAPPAGYFKTKDERTKARTALVEALERIRRAKSF